MSENLAKILFCDITSKECSAGTIESNGKTRRTKWKSVLPLNPKDPAPRHKLSDKVRSNQLAFNLRILPLPSLATFHSAIIGHSIIHKSAPPYILELFPPKYSSRPSRRLSLPSNSHYNKIEQHIVSSFNCAPKSICSLSRLNFKSRLKSHLLS